MQTKHPWSPFQNLGHHHHRSSKTPNSAPPHSSPANSLSGYLQETQSMKFQVCITLAFWEFDFLKSSRKLHLHPIAVASCFHLKKKAIGTLKALWENLGFGGRGGWEETDNIWVLHLVPCFGKQKTRSQNYLCLCFTRVWYNWWVVTAIYLAVLVVLQWTIGPTQINHYTFCAQICLHIKWIHD